MSNNNENVVKTSPLDAVKAFFGKILPATSGFFKKLFKPRRSLDATKARAGYFFVLPFILGVVLIYLPIFIDSVWYSFSNFTDIQVEVWDEELGANIIKHITGTTGVGFEHYVTAFEDQTFYQKLLASVQEMLFQVPAIIIFSLFIAVVLNQKMLGRAAFRAIFFIPVIISTGVMESINAEDFMKEEMGSGINDGTQQNSNDIINILDVQNLFASMKVGTELVTYVVGLVNDIYNIINYSGVQMLIFLAGLQSISPSIYEACQIEGATGWETFWKVTFPMISPMILVNAVYTVIDAFTRTTNPAMNYASDYSGTPGVGVAMSWIYFLIVTLIIAIVGAIASSFVFYQRRD
ncbi:MAG: sugar ABC transporter permease [Clostridia bacterium]|nr:sugar ABC transporter permease [Clostridia bacterium]